jgi:hypothetical protein
MRRALIAVVVVVAEERGEVFSQDEQDALFREAEANFEAAQQTGEGVGNYLEEKLAEQIRYALERRGDEGAAGGDYINHVTQELLECRVIGAEEEWRVIEAEDEALQYAQEQHAGNGDTGQVGSYLDQVTDDRQAIERMEQDLAGGGDDQRLGIMLRLNEAVNQHAQQFVEDMPVQCSSLPEEAVEEIRAETSTKLGAKMEFIVSQMARPVGAPSSGGGGLRGAGFEPERPVAGGGLQWCGPTGPCSRRAGGL